MEQKIAVGVDDFAAQRTRYHKRAAVDLGPRGGRDNGGDVTRRATDLIEELFAGRDVGGDGSARWNFRRTYESGERGNVLAIVFRVGDRIVPGAESYESAVGHVVKSIYGVGYKLDL